MIPALRRSAGSLGIRHWALVVSCLSSSVCLGAESASELPASATPPDAQDLVFLGPLRPLWVRLHITIDGTPFRQSWLERFDDAFGGEDTDGDGKVTAEQAAVVARLMNGGLREQAKIDFKALAGDSDRIARSTLLAEVERQLPPFTLRRRAVITQGSALALFPLLDTDRNQQLSPDELSVAEERLRQRDFDDDQVITAEELIFDPNAIAAAADPTGAPADLAGDGGPVMLVTATTTRDQIAARLLAHYDRNRDGRLSTRAPGIEIKLPPAVLSRLDRDNDGTLDPVELAAFSDRAPDMELTFAMGQATARQRRSTSRQPADPEIRVRKTLQDGYAIELGEARIACKLNNRDPQQTGLVELRTFDRDSNGYIDAGEASAGNIGKETLAAMDTDGDGKVFKGEFSSFMGRQNAASAVRLQLEVRDFGQDLFDIFDTDMDRMLSQRELRTARDVLTTADKNGDGLLSGEEVPLRVELELARGVDERSETETRMSPNRRKASTAKANTAGPTWFRKMDRNNDGDLSPHEFIGPPATFQKLDTNGDGLIDREEAEAVK